MKNCVLVYFALCVLVYFAVESFVVSTSLWSKFSNIVCFYIRHFQLYDDVSSFLCRKQEYGKTPDLWLENWQCLQIKSTDTPKLDSNSDSYRHRYFIFNFIQ